MLVQITVYGYCVCQGLKVKVQLIKAEQKEPNTLDKYSDMGCEREGDHLEKIELVNQGFMIQN